MAGPLLEDGSDCLPLGDRTECLHPLPRLPGDFMPVDKSDLPWLVGPRASSWGVAPVDLDRVLDPGSVAGAKRRVDWTLPSWACPRGFLRGWLFAILESIQVLRVTMPRWLPWESILWESRAESGTVLPVIGYWFVDTDGVTRGHWLCSTCL